jgi:hypothetical protein
MTAPGYSESRSSDQEHVHDPDPQHAQTGAGLLAAPAAPFPLPVRRPAPVIRRYNGLDGVAGDLTVESREVLLHGTEVQAFDPDRMEASTGMPRSPLERSSAELPDAPAWFSKIPAFSLHAAARFNQGNVYLRQYTVSRPIRLLAFDDVADLNAYLTSMGSPAVGINDATASNLLQRMSGDSFDGYMLTRDMVRREPEYVLWASGLAKLVPTENELFRAKPSKWDQQPGQDRGPKTNYKGDGGSRGQHDTGPGGPGTFTMFAQ